MVFAAAPPRAPVDPRHAADLVRRVAPPGAHVEVDEDHLLVFVRRDMLHLDADALHDRLAHWSATELARVLPRATATVSFRHASPAHPHEASTLDLQEGWLDLEPTFALELRGASADELQRFASLVARFMETMEKEGRPAGYRSPEVGSVE